MVAQIHLNVMLYVHCLSCLDICVTVPGTDNIVLSHALHSTSSFTATCITVRDTVTKLESQTKLFLRHAIIADSLKGITWISYFVLRFNLQKSVSPHTVI